MHTIMHCSTVSVAYVTTPTYASTNDHCGRLAFLLVTVKNWTVSVQFRSVHLRRCVRALKLHALRRSRKNQRKVFVCL